MKTLLALFLSCFACVVLGQAPPIQRNVFTTNLNGPAMGVVTSIVQNSGHIINRTPLFDNRTDLNFVTNVYAGQWAVTYGGAANNEPVVNVSKSIGLGQANYGMAMNFPGGIRSLGGSQFGTGFTNVPDSGRVFWFMNGDKFNATSTNAETWSDNYWAFYNVSPYAASYVLCPANTALQDYSYGGAPALFTNAMGVPIYLFDPFGLQMGTTPPDFHPYTGTNPAPRIYQPGSMVHILGGRLDNPYHLSGNESYGGVLGQYPWLTIDRRGLTNNLVSPVVIGIPLAVADCYEPTQSIAGKEWKWAMVVNHINGDVSITNSTQYVRAVVGTGTNAGSFVFGGGAAGLVGTDYAGVNNFNGNASFNAPSGWTGNNAAWAFDAAAAHRGGIGVQSGMGGPRWVTGAGSAYVLTFGNASDLLSSPATQVWTNWFVADAATRTAYYSNVVSLGLPAAAITNMNATNTPALNVSVSGKPNALIVNSNGNVGIGTATPTNALNVQGNANVTGSLIVTANQTNTGNLRADGGLQVNVGANRAALIEANGAQGRIMASSTGGLGISSTADAGGVDSVLGRASAGVFVTSAAFGSSVANVSLSTSNLTLTGGIVGFTNATDASGGVNGFVGQFTNVLLATGSAIALPASNVTTNTLTLTLTAGDWDVEANANFNLSAATVTGSVAGISTNSLTLPTDGSEVYTGTEGNAFTTTTSITLPRKRINVSAPMTVYLVTKSSYSAGSLTTFGAMTARRVR